MTQGGNHPPRRLRGLDEVMSGQLFGQHLAVVRDAVAAVITSPMGVASVA